MAECASVGRAYPENHALLHKPRQLPHPPLGVLACPSPPEHAGLLIGREIDGLEGHLIRPQNGLEARRGRHDVRGAGGEGSEDVEGRVGREGRRAGGHFGGSGGASRASWR